MTVIVATASAGRVVLSGGRPPRRISPTVRNFTLSFTAVATYPDAVEFEYLRQMDGTDYLYFYNPLANYGGNVKVADQLNHAPDSVEDQPTGGLYFNFVIRRLLTHVDLAP